MRPPLNDMPTCSGERPRHAKKAAPASSDERRQEQLLIAKLSKPGQGRAGIERSDHEPCRALFQALPHPSGS